MTIAIVVVVINELEQTDRNPRLAWSPDRPFRYFRDSKIRRTSFPNYIKNGRSIDERRCSKIAKEQVGSLVRQSSPRAKLP